MLFVRFVDTYGPMHTMTSNKEACKLLTTDKPIITEKEQKYVKESFEK